MVAGVVKQAHTRNTAFQSRKWENAMYELSTIMSLYLSSPCSRRSTYSNRLAEKSSSRSASRTR